MGQIRKRGAFYQIRYYRNGQRIEESTKLTKWEDARDLLKVKEGDIAKGVPLSPKVGRVRFDEAAADLEREYEANARRSLKGVKRKIKLHLTPFFGGRRMADITTADVNAFIVQRQQADASNAEINRELAALKRMFNLAIKAGKLYARPHIPMLAERNVRTGFFEREQFEEVRKHLPTDLQPIATFAYLTGWRTASEVLPLEWRQVDLQAGVARLEPGTTKNSEGRVFPFGDHLPELRDVLEEQWRRTKAVEQARGVIIAKVFHRAGRAVKDFRWAWKSACETPGCPTRIPHDFRRTAVRNLVRAGVPERVAMQLTGHKTRSVFDRYDIVNEADLRSGIEKLGHAMAGTNTGTNEGSRTVRRIRSSR